MMTWTYGDLLRKARTSAGLNQDSLAAHVRVSRATISSWECDRTRPDVAEFLRIMDATGADWLLDQVRDLALHDSVCESLTLAA